MERGAWWATVHGFAEELDLTERLSTRVYLYINIAFFFLVEFLQNKSESYYYQRKLGL